GALALALATAAAPAAAQASGGAGAKQGGSPPSGPRRARLEQQVRERFGRVVQQRLGLTDAQLSRLAQTNQRFDGERRALFQRERQVRLALRDEVGNEGAANQQRVDELIRSAIQIQRQRLDLVEREQQELAGFMTPVQRARYLDLQEKLRRRVEQLRSEQRGAGSEGRVGDAAAPGQGRPLLRRRDATP
ncbi:MAG: hypothetical protein ACJ79S_09485, partial [Gemmatimonadaceae bacterium]